MKATLRQLVGGAAAVLNGARQRPAAGAGMVAAAALLAALLELIGGPLVLGVAAWIAAAVATTWAAWSVQRNTSDPLTPVAAISAAAVGAVGWWALATLVRPYAAWILAAAVVAAVAGSRSHSRTRTRSRGKSRVPGSHVNADGTAKVEYSSKSDARRAADRLHAKDGAAMGVYRCERGSHWHVGHQRSR